jgi:hypothetical protein
MDEKYAPTLTDLPTGNSDNNSEEEKGRVVIKQTLLRVNKRFATVITTSLGIVAGIMWTDAIKSLFAPTGILRKWASHGVWYTAIMTTLLAFAATSIVSRLYGDEEVRID